MEVPQLTEDELAEVRRFFGSQACHKLWESFEAQIMAKWLIATDTTSREECWLKLQAVLSLQAILRDATANTRLDQRAKENASRTP